MTDPVLPDRGVAERARRARDERGARAINPTVHEGWGEDLADADSDHEGWLRRQRPPHHGE